LSREEGICRIIIRTFVYFKSNSNTTLNIGFKPKILLVSLLQKKLIGRKKRRRNLLKRKQEIRKLLNKFEIQMIVILIRN